MQVANCTEDNVTYTVGPGPIGTPLDRYRWDTKPQPHPEEIVIFYESGVEIARSRDNLSDDTIVTLHKVNGAYFVTELTPQP